LRQAVGTIDGADASGAHVNGIPDNFETRRVARSFQWTTTPAGRCLVDSALSTFARHLFTTRQLQFRDGSVDADYGAIARAFDVPSSSIVRVRQVHGKDVLTIDSRDAVPLPGAAAADAVITTSPGVVVSVRVADCVPILMADRARRVVAAIHAGWRGTAAGVARETVLRISGLGIDPASLVAAIGPSIGPCCYQVDLAVQRTFAHAWSNHERWFTPDGSDRWTLDLVRANQDQLVDAGVPLGSVSIAGLCTADNLEDFFSYRREGAGTGRMVAAIGLGC
jgi:YfiH family protein